jgi:VanZ family protein
MHWPAARVSALLAYGALIAWLSLRQVVEMPPGQWDKAGHFLAYGIFGWLGGALVREPRGTLAMAAGIVAYSGALEIAQGFVPGRQPSLGDLLANAVGVALGLALATRGFSALRRAVAPRLP